MKDDEVLTSIKKPDISINKDNILILIRHFKGLVACYEDMYKQANEAEIAKRHGRIRERIKDYDIKPVK